MKDEEGHPTRKLSKTTRELGPLLTWGWQFALTLGALAWFGRWLDGKFVTKVLITLMRLFMGLFGGFYNLYRIVSMTSVTKNKTGEK